MREMKVFNNISILLSKYGQLLLDEDNRSDITSKRGIQKLVGDITVVISIFNILRVVYDCFRFR